MTVYKKVPIAKEYEMSVDGHIRRVDGEECELYLETEISKIYLPNINQAVDKKWLTYITHFEVDLSLKETMLVKFENSHKWRFSNKYNLRMRLPNIPLVSNKYKIIPDFTRYAISNDGEVFDRYESKVVKANKPVDNYYITINIYSPDKGKVCSVVLHRLVALAWVSLKDPMRQYLCNHIDGNKHNYYYTNLEWTNYSGNTQHACDTQLAYMHSCKVKDFQDSHIHKFNSIKDAFIFMNIKQRAIRDFNTHTLLKGRYQIKLDSDITDWKIENKFPGYMGATLIQSFNISTNEIKDFPSMKEASRQLNMQFATIRNFVKLGEQYISNGYCFRYMPEIINDRKKWTTNFLEPVSGPKRIFGSNGITKEVKKFNSVSEAETSTGINRKAIIRSLNGKSIKFDWTFKPYWKT